MPLYGSTLAGFDENSFIIGIKRAQDTEWELYNQRLSEHNNCYGKSQDLFHVPRLGLELKLGWSQSFFIHMQKTELLL